ncbi:uncharacterized protein LOC134250015 [Saccostrea cucullata]|uniref:uncharacterized protein LOC134250015 n=2 Tax=Saccostrea cuccullata TaxID=36930 RepID=UPI002ED1DED8
MFGNLKICGVKSHKKISIRKSTDIRRKTSTSHVVVGTIKSGLGPASLVARVSTEEVWVARRSTLRRMNTKNEILEEVILSDGIALDICLLLNKYVVHSNNFMNMICVNRNGLIDTLIKLAKWSPFGICNTSSGDLLVCLRTDIGHQGKVVRLSGSNVTQEIQYDTEGKPLLSKKASGLFVAENKNSDVCVSDPGGEAVIVVNKSGNLRFRFRGQEMFECFTPYGIVTDTMSQILVADRDNDSIHIIDCDGKFLRFIKGSGLHQPFSLSITKNNLLFVSSGTEDKISIVQYTD